MAAIAGLVLALATPPQPAAAAPPAAGQPDQPGFWQVPAPPHSGPQPPRPVDLQLFEDPSRYETYGACDEDELESAREAGAQVAVCIVFGVPSAETSAFLRELVASSAGLSPTVPLPEWCHDDSIGLPHLCALGSPG